MSDPISGALIGLGAGMLSGMFGVGGGLLTTPAIRLLLGAPALIAVGTPLPVIIPTAIAGAWQYRRSGMAEIGLGVSLGLWGATASLLGAYLSELAGGTFVMLATAGIIGYMAIDMIRAAVLGPALRSAPFREGTQHRGLALAGLGLLTGLYSGFLGLGGGFVLVPMLGRVFGMPIKRAIGTSLVAVAVLAVPGTLAHWWLGHVDVAMALSLAIGVVPGAVVGARLTQAADEKLVRLGFAGLLVLSGTLLALTELGVIGL